jgi:hypothetical protein
MIARDLPSRVRELWTRASLPLAFGALLALVLVGFLFITGLADFHASGYDTASVLQQALRQACRLLVPWLLLWLFITPALQRVPVAQPWLALIGSAVVAVWLVPATLSVSGPGGQGGSDVAPLVTLGLLTLVLTLPVVRANDVWLPAIFLAAAHVVIASLFGLPFAGNSTGVLATSLTGDTLVTGGRMGPVFGFVGMLGMVWLGWSILQHQSQLFAGAASRRRSRERGLLDLAGGILMAGAAVALVWAGSLAAEQIRVGEIRVAVAPLAASLTTLLPEALASVIWTCAIVTAMAWIATGRGLIAAFIATDVAAAIHFVWTPGANLYSTAGVFAMSLAVTMAFARTGRLWLPVGLAFGWALFEGPIFGFPTPGFPMRQPWLSQDILQYSAMTGGVLGPGASVLATAAKALLAGAVLYSTRRRRP